MGSPVDFPSAVLHDPQGAGAGADTEPATPVKTGLANLQTLTDRVIVQRFAPIGVLCNDKGDILYISGRAGKYMEPAVGKANMNIFAMARDGLRYELSRAFSSATRQEGAVTVTGIQVGTNGGRQNVNLTVRS